MNRRRFLKALAGGAVLLFAPRVAWCEALDARIQKLDLEEVQWRKRLTPAQFDILRRGGTEEPFSSPLVRETRKGLYACAGCGLPLFPSEFKYDNRSGWPSFFNVLAGHVQTRADTRQMVARLEYHCARCGGHQGHILDDGPEPKGLHYSNNGVALRFLPASEDKAREGGFTLIELAIVLVVIGLIVGGVLVGQSLISAAAVRGTVGQVEKFNQAVNTFRDKYGYLPGDIPPGPAYQFGLSAHSGYQYMGDGNGVIQGTPNPCQWCTVGNGIIQGGEPYFFWQDLISGKLIEGASGGCFGPAAIAGNGNCFFVWSGGAAGGDGVNYYDLSVPINLSGYGRCSWCLASNPGLTVAQAYAIDLKMDDGFPQSGNVKSLYLSADNQGNDNVAWAAPSQFGIAANAWGATPTAFANGWTTATPGSSSTCFDNGNVAGAQQQYSMEISGGSNITCALSFRFQ